MAKSTTIVERGLAASTCLLDINPSFAVPRDFPLPYPWNLPSRLFQFPIEISAAEGDGPRRVGLMHPLLAAHPFVQHVEATLGLTLDTDGAPNACGVSKALTGQWWHAVDLVSAGQCRSVACPARHSGVHHGRSHCPRRGLRPHLFPA